MISSQRHRSGADDRPTAEAGHDRDDGHRDSSGDQLLDQLLAIEPVADARSTLAIRTVLSRRPLPLDPLP